MAGQTRTIREMHRKLTLLSLSTLSGCALVRILASSTPAFATPGQGASDAGSDRAAGDADAGSGCAMVAQGGVTAQLACTTRQDSRSRDAGDISTAVWIDSVAGPSMALRLIFVGKPKLGLQAARPAGAAAYARAHVEQARVEWEAISDIQGTFDVTVTSVRTIRTAGRDSYEIHGVVEAELPYTNLPVGNPTLPVNLRVSF